jgi:hypothetical protein
MYHSKAHALLHENFPKLLTIFQSAFGDHALLPSTTTTGARGCQLLASRGSRTRRRSRQRRRQAMRGTLEKRHHRKLAQGCFVS